MLPNTTTDRPVRRAPWSLPVVRKVIPTTHGWLVHSQRRRWHFISHSGERLGPFSTKARAYAAVRFCRSIPNINA